MMVMFSRSDHSLLSQEIHSPLSREIESLLVKECAQAFVSFNAYGGRYTLNGNTVTHQIELASIPNRVGIDLVRTFSLSGDQVTLKTLSTSSDGALKVFELVWERLQS